MVLILWALDQAGLGGSAWAAVLILVVAASAGRATLLAARAVAGEAAARARGPVPGPRPGRRLDRDHGRRVFHGRERLGSRAGDPGAESRGAPLGPPRDRLRRCSSGCAASSRSASPSRPDPARGRDHGEACRADRARHSCRRRCSRSPSGCPGSSGSRGSSRSASSTSRASRRRGRTSSSSSTTSRRLRSSSGPRRQSGSRGCGTGGSGCWSARALLAVVLADLSGMSKAEVERIWLPFLPWVMLATAALPVGRAGADGTPRRTGRARDHGPARRRDDLVSTAERILVVGGAGFIGSHVVDELVAHGRRVRVLDIAPSRWPTDGKPEYLNAEAEYIWGDIRDPATVAAALAGGRRGQPSGGDGRPRGRPRRHRRLRRLTMRSGRPSCCARDAPRPVRRAGWSSRAAWSSTARVATMLGARSVDATAAGDRGPCRRALRALMRSVRCGASSRTPVGERRPLRPAQRLRGDQAPPGAPGDGLRAGVTARR